MARLRRIEALLNVPLDEVTYADLERLATSRVVEDVDIDFKSEPHRDGQDLAVDVSAMANTVGGVLVIGMAEAEGAATELRPCPLSDDDTNRMRQWLAELVVPYVSTEVMRVPEGADGTRGCYLVIVERSPNAPHAVRKGAALRYYQRDGGRNRPLSEAEVADAYRNRFRGAAAQGQRLDTIATDGRAAVLPISAETVWLAMALMPNAPGAMTIDAPQLRRVRKVLAGGLGSGPFRAAPRELTTGVGRAIAISSYEHGTTRPRFGYAELHVDGGGFVAAELHNAQQQGPPDEHIVVRLDDVQLVRTGLGLLRLLSDHATLGASTHGDAVARCELLTAAEDVRLGYHNGGIWDPYDTARVLRSAPSVGSHTVSLDAIGDSRTEWLAAGRLLLTDLFHAFGVPEVPQITNEGHLRRSYWRGTNIETIPSFGGVPITGETVDFYC